MGVMENESIERRSCYTKIEVGWIHSATGRARFLCQDGRSEWYKFWYEIHRNEATSCLKFTLL